MTLARYTLGWFAIAGTVALLLWLIVVNEWRRK